MLVTGAPLGETPRHPKLRKPLFDQPVGRDARCCCNDADESSRVLPADGSVPLGPPSGWNGLDQVGRSPRVAWIHFSSLQAAGVTSDESI